MNKNRECPNCKQDCGKQAENYPPTITGGFILHICNNCKITLYSDFKYPDFFWNIPKTSDKLNNQKHERNKNR